MIKSWLNLAGFKTPHSCKQILVLRFMYRKEGPGGRYVLQIYAGAHYGKQSIFLRARITKGGGSFVKLIGFELHLLLSSVAYFVRTEIDTQPSTFT